MEKIITQNTEAIKTSVDFIIYGLAGIGGAILKIKKKKDHKIKVSFADGFISVIAGAMTASFLTPLFLELVVNQIFNISKSGEFGVAFIIGFIGYEGIEIIIDKFKK